MQIGIPWENANKLDIAMIMDMAKEGYTFWLEDGKIACVMITINFCF